MTEQEVIAAFVGQTIIRVQLQGPSSSGPGPVDGIWTVVLGNGRLFRFLAVGAYDPGVEITELIPSDD